MQDENLMGKVDFVNTENFNNIPQWTSHKCIRYLGCSEPIQSQLAGLDGRPVKIAREAAAARIMLISQQRTDKPNIHESDYPLILQLLNMARYLIIMKLRRWRFNSMLLNSAANGDVGYVEKYSLNAFLYLLGPLDDNVRYNKW